MPATVVPQTRDELPVGAPREMTVGYCQVCHPAELLIAGDEPVSPYTRSLVPGDDGRYELQFHELWCPVWSGARADPGCPAPRCGAPITSYDYQPGYQIKIPGLNMNGQPITETWVGTGDDTPPANVLAYAAGPPEPAPFADKLTVQPCGHTLEGDDARRVLHRAGELAAARREQEAEDTLAGHADLLTAAERAGHPAVAEQYRQAVRDRSADQRGILVALRALTGG